MYYSVLLTCAYNSVYVSTYIPTYIHTYVHTYVHAYMVQHYYVCMYICTYTSMYVCEHVCRYVDTYIPEYWPCNLRITHTYIHTCIHAYVCIYICNYVSTYFAFIEITVKFNNTLVFVDEVPGILQGQLVLNDTSPIAITVHLITNDINATGMVNYIHCICIHCTYTYVRISAYICTYVHT